MGTMRDDGWSFVNTYTPTGEQSDDALVLFVHRERGTWGVRSLHGKDYVEHETFNEAIESIKRRLSGTDEQEYTQALLVSRVETRAMIEFLIRLVYVRLRVDGWYVDRTGRAYDPSLLYRYVSTEAHALQERIKTYEATLETARAALSSVDRLLDAMTPLVPDQR